VVQYVLLSVHISIVKYVWNAYLYYQILISFVLLWGFQSGKSTVTALLETTYDWFTHLEAGRDIGSVFFGLRKGFDTVPHRALMTKLQQLNVIGDRR